MVPHPPIGADNPLIRQLRHSDIDVRVATANQRGFTNDVNHSHPHGDGNDLPGGTRRPGFHSRHGRSQRNAAGTAGRGCEPDFDLGIPVRHGQRSRWIRLCRLLRRAGPRRHRSRHRDRNRDPGVRSGQGCCDQRPGQGPRPLPRFHETPRCLRAAGRFAVLGRTADGSTLLATFGQHRHAPEGTR